MVLTTLKEEQAPDEARYLLERSSVEQPETASRAIIELVTTIKETRVYREIKEEGRLEGERSLILCQLTRLLGELPQRVVPAPRATPGTFLSTSVRVLVCWSSSTCRGTT